MKPPIETPAAALLGTGRTADVLAWGPGWVLKLFHRPFSSEYARHEQRIALAIHAALGDASFRAPEVGRVIAVDARVGLTYGFAAGALLTRAYAQEAPHERGLRVGERLARIHRAIHRIDSRRHPSLNALPDQRQQLRHAIAAAAALSPAHRQALTDRLEAADCSALSLCHGDFHPHNILQDASGTATVIDWCTADLGSPLCDVARTSLLLRFAPIAGAKQIDPAQAEMRHAIQQAYLNAYFSESENPQSRAEYERWLPLVAAARLVNGIGAAEQADLLGFIQQRLSLELPRSNGRSPATFHAAC